MKPTHLTPPQRDRIAGVLVGQACGDALGVPNEFKPAFTDRVPEMIGGGLGAYAPGEWSDDTQMAICIAQVLAERALASGVTAGGADDETPLDPIVDTASLGRIALAFSDWRMHGASDIGTQTSVVLALADRLRSEGARSQGWHLSESREDADAGMYMSAAETYTQQQERSAGNGALMRNGIIGVHALHDRDATAENARNIARLTHADPLVLDSCVLHAEAIRHAVLTGEYDLMRGIDLLPLDRRPRWIEWLETATDVDPTSIEANGSTFGALRAAHAAITYTRVMKFSSWKAGTAAHLRAALEVAASTGHDTDTVAAITGALLGATYGSSAIPARWRRQVHGWPGMRSRDLMCLALQTAGQADSDEWPTRATEPAYGDHEPVPLPADPGVLLGTQSSLAHADVEAVVSLSRIGSRQLRFGTTTPERHVEFWIVDSDDPSEHNGLGAVLQDAADTIATLRGEGHRVLLHCVHALKRSGFRSVLMW